MCSTVLAVQREQRNTALPNAVKFSGIVFNFSQLINAEGGILTKFQQWVCFVSHDMSCSEFLTTKKHSTDTRKNPLNALKQQNISASVATNRHCLSLHDTLTCHCVNIYSCYCTAAGPEATFTVTSFILIINNIKALRNNSMHQNTRSTIVVFCLI